ncbi:MAG: RraA family protein [Candidatus Dormiibacterota bacterium]
MTLPLTLEQIQLLARMDTCTVANTIEQFHVRLRNEGFCDGTIRCMLPSLPPIAGYAVTAKIRCSVPPTFGPGFHDRTDWWDLILRSPEPRIVVLEDVDARPGVGAFIGELHGNIIRALGCVGCVTNGAVRNLPVAEKIGLQMFAGSVSVSHAFAHLLSFGEPVEIGGLRICTGDLLHGDQHGVINVPIEIVSQIPSMAAKMNAQRGRVIEFCRSSNLSIEGLRKMIQELE